jgi:poly(A) polymerase
MEDQRDFRQMDGDLAGLREAAVEVVRRLVAGGHVAYFAGGCVRDRLLGLAATDYDIATDARPDDVLRVFPRAQNVGQSFGVSLVRLAGHMIQVATFRTDGAYSDGRHPDGVTFSDAQHDAGRRDFTINGLFENPLTNEVIDYVGGRTDLAAKVVRAIGDAHARLREDRLRTLRAVRFAAKFGFSIDPETADAIRASATELKGVSRERIGQEVRRMLGDPNRAVAAWEMQYLGLDTAVLGEENRLVAPTRLGRLPDHADFPTALAAWLLDRHGDRPEEAPTVVGRWAEALMLSNDEFEAVSSCLEVYQTFLTTWPHLGVAAQKRLAASAWFDPGLMVLQATDRQAFVDVRRKVIELAQTELAPKALIDGSHLIALGLKPGPLFSRVLRAVYDAQLEGAVKTPDEAISMAKAVASPEFDGRFANDGETDLTPP